MTQVRLGAEARGRRLDAPVALDPHLVGTVDHDLVDARVGEQRLERPKAERALGDAGRERRAGVVGQQPRLAVDELPDALMQVSVAVLRRLTQKPVAQRRGQLLERGLSIVVFHTPYRPRAAETRPPADRACRRRGRARRRPRGT